jgi:Beta-lactamase enzyme family
MTFFKQDTNLENIGNKICTEIWQKFPTLGQEQIALTCLLYDQQIKGFNYRGDQLIYPASIVKLFYLVAVYQWLESGKLTISNELNRAITDMIVESSNDATSLIVDSITCTTSGPELDSNSMENWTYQRNAINRYFQSFKWPELAQINVNQKTWCDGPYGRERAFVGEFYTNRNMLTTNAVARLFHNIISKIAVSPSASKTMLDLLKRDPNPITNCDENQISGFLGQGLPENSQIYSKAGWTSKVRHDAAYIQTPDKLPYLLVVFTEGEINSQNREILPTISQLFYHYL